MSSGAATGGFSSPSLVALPRGTLSSHCSMGRDFLKTGLAAARVGAGGGAGAGVVAAPVVRSVDDSAWSLVVSAWSLVLSAWSAEASGAWGG